MSAKTYKTTTEPVKQPQNSHSNNEKTAAKFVDILHD